MKSGSFTGMHNASNDSKSRTSSTEGGFGGLVFWALTKERNDQLNDQHTAISVNPLKIIEACMDVRSNLHFFPYLQNSSNAVTLNSDVAINQHLLHFFANKDRPFYKRTTTECEVCRQKLQKAIRKSKGSSLKQLCKKSDINILGDPYRTIIAKLKGGGDQVTDLKQVSFYSKANLLRRS